MKASMKNPVFYQDSLFVIQGYEVLLYEHPIIHGKFSTDFVTKDRFSFSDPVEKIEVKPIGLVVTTSRDYLVINGGPNSASYFVNLLANRAEGYVLSEDGGTLIRER